LVAQRPLSEKRFSSQSQQRRRIITDYTINGNSD